MILRIDDASATEASGQEAWPAFEKTQRTTGRFTGCISQPAHAALAARWAAALKPEVFGVLPPEVIDAIARHDAGWADHDLTALEWAGEQQPRSFLAYPAEVRSPGMAQVDPRSRNTFSSRRHPHQPPLLPARAPRR